MKEQLFLFLSVLFGKAELFPLAAQDEKDGARGKQPDDRRQKQRRGQGETPETQKAQGGQKRRAEGEEKIGNKGGFFHICIFDRNFFG